MTRDLRNEETASMPRTPSRTARRWLTAVAIAGLAAGAMAAGLLWMVLTRPVVLAQIVGGLR